MFFIYSLAALALLSALIFAVPLRAEAWTALALVGVGALAGAACAIGVLADGTTLRLWTTPGTLFGGDSGSMDPLSALFTLVIAVGSVASVLYSHGYLEHTLAHKSPAHVSLHYTALATMCFAMLGVVCSDGGYSFLFCWELMTVASFLLILYDAERREVLRAALSYLLMMHVGFALLVVGFVRLHAACGTGDFAALGDCFAQGGALPLFVLFLAGFGMKAGLFPMHVWLPEAHPAAPSHVSALMSGVMIKTGVYGILRVTAALGCLPELRTAGFVLLAAGAATGLWGAILAASQNDIKRLLAYSSIENIGIILLGLGTAALGKSAGNQPMALCGIAGALLHTVNHSCFKSLLFFGAGNILSQTRTTALDRLGGLMRHMPLTGGLLLAGAAAICALPPLSGFVSEFAIYLGLLDGVASGSDPLAAAAGIAALALIGGIVLLAFTKLCGTVLLGSPRTHEVAEASEVDGLRIAAMALPLAGIILVGLFPHTAVEIVLRAATSLTPLPSEAASLTLSPTLAAVGRTAWLLVAVVAALACLRRRLLRGRRVTEGPTWGCGFTAVNTRMQYTGESFSEGLQSIATHLTQERVEGRSVDRGEIFPAAHNFAIRRKDRFDRLFSAWWVALLHQINVRAMRLRTGKINHYLLFALAFLGLVLLLSLFNLL